MPITRRSALTLLGTTVAAPYLLHSKRAEAAATLTPLGSPIFLGAGQAGGKFGVSLAAFPDPAQGFIAGWTNVTGGAARNFIQYFKSDGTTLSAPIEMSGPAGTTDGTFANGVFPIARSDGKALILFGAKNDNADEFDAVDIFSQRMSVARGKIGDPALINSLIDLDQGDPLGVRLSNGNFLAAWTSIRGSLDTIDVRGRIINFAGVGLSNDRRIHPENAGEQRPRSVTALGGGRSVVGYSSLIGNTKWNLRAVVLNADGTRARDPFQLRQVPVDQQFGSAAVLARAPKQDKWLAIGHAKNPDTGLARLWFQDFDFITRLHQSRNIGSSFTIDDGPPENAPGVCTAGADRVFVQHWGFSNNKQVIHGIVVDVSTTTETAPRVVIHSSTTDTRPEALIRLPQQQVYVSGFSDGINTDISTAKARIQRMQLNLS